jgi:hypothetical protein
MRERIDIEAPITTSQMRDVSKIVPGFKRKEQYWENHKDRFVCETGASNRDFNNHIIEVFVIYNYI